MTLQIENPIVPLAPKQISGLDEEMKAWEQLGIDSLLSFYEKVHDHGWYETPDGRLVAYPSGEPGEICKTCGKTILPLEQVFPIGDSAYIGTVPYKSE